MYSIPIQGRIKVPYPMFGRTDPAYQMFAFICVSCTTAFPLATGIYSVVKFMVGTPQNQYLGLSPTSDDFVF